MLTHRLNIAALIVGTILFFVLKQFLDLSFWVLAFLILLFVFFTVLGSFSIQMNYHLKAFNKASGNEIALTFDDGPTPYTLEILALLKTYNQKATFFCVGKQAEKYPEIIKQIVAEGHTLGNHTYSHSPKTGFLNRIEMEHEIREANRVIQAICDKNMKLYRPPFGVTNPSIKRALSTTQHNVIGWNVRSLDTVIDNSDKILNRILAKTKGGSIILLHDTSEKSVKVVAEFLRVTAYKSVTIDKILNLEAYEV